MEVNKPSPQTPKRPDMSPPPSKFPTSTSQNDLMKEQRNKSYEGIKRFATSFKHTVRTSKVDVDKVRHKEKRTIMDPRFRRERKRSPKRSPFSQSESKFIPHLPQDDKLSFSAPSFKDLDLDLEETTKIGSTTNIPAPTLSQVVTEGEVTRTLDSHSANVKATNTVLKLNKCVGEDGDRVKENMRDVQLETDFSKVSIGCDCSRGPSYPIRKRSNRVIRKFSSSVPKPNCTPKNLYWDDSRLYKKYTNILRPAAIRKSTSSFTMPIMSPNSEESLCLCSNSSGDQVKDGYSYESGSDYGSSAVLPADNRSNDEEMTSFYYLVGCAIGLLIVTATAWLLTDDTIWLMVNKNRRLLQEQQNATYTQWALQTLRSICGKVIYAMNVVASSLWDLFSQKSYDAALSWDQWDMPN